MCGIAGIFEYGRSQGSVSEATLLHMRETLHHRGPDGAGLYISPDRRVGLGVRRLAIIDLAGGEQPMFGRNGETLVFNGEIYNYPALRRALEERGVAFGTDCDTEIIVRLYELYGERCVDHLNGMFAFAVWDPARERLFFARDRVGEKPLYWTQTDGRLLFASEIKALLAHPLVEPAVEADAIPEYLTNLVTSSPRTLYKGIYKQRTSTERGNSQSKAAGLERPKVRNIHSVRNLNTLTYLVINARALQRARRLNASLLTTMLGKVL